MVSVSEGGSSRWTFLTHHARVLMEISRHPNATMRDIAATIGITERAVHGIITDLHEAGYLTRERIGRRNHYSVDPAQHLRYPTEATIPVGRLIEVFVDHDLGVTGEPGDQEGERRTS